MKKKCKGEGIEAKNSAGDSLPRWYAVHTRSRHEKLVARQFLEKQIEAFLPLRTEVHRWKDRHKQVEVPLFSGYVFAQFARGSQQRQAVLRTAGVIRIVGFGQRDEPVPNEQIDALRRVLESEVHLEKHKYLRVGQRVRVISGALAGVAVAGCSGKPALPGADGPAHLCGRRGHGALGVCRKPAPGTERSSRKYAGILFRRHAGTRSYAVSLVFLRGPGRRSGLASPPRKDLNPCEPSTPQNPAARPLPQSLCLPG